MSTPIPKLPAALTVANAPLSSSKTDKLPLPPEIPETRMRAALRVVDPSLNDVDLDKHVVWYRENAAVGQVKRVIAALCGAPYDSYPPDSLAVISRTFLTELKTAVLTARVVEALQQEIGEPATCELLSSLSIVA